MPASANVWDPRPRPGFIGVPPTRDPRPRPHVRLDPASGPMDSSRSTRDPRPQCPPINLPTSFQLQHPELSLPSPTTPSESSGQIVAMNSRPAGRKWLTREDLKKLPRIPKNRYDANVAPTSTSGLGPKTTLAMSTSTPMPPPQLPPNLEQRHDSSDSGIATRPSATQRETGKSMTTCQQRHFSPQTPTGPSSRLIATNESSCSEISQVLSLPITPPLTPTEDFTSGSLCQFSNNSPETIASSMKRQYYYSSIQERDSVVTSWGRISGVQSTLKPETKETTGPLESTQNRIANFRSASPLKNTGNTTSQNQTSSPPARAVTDANGRTVTAADYLPAHTTQQARSPKEFNMESYDSCDCTSDGGEECMYCQILKGAFEFCQRVDQMVKER